MKPCTISVDPTARARCMCGRELNVLARQARPTLDPPDQGKTGTSQTELHHPTGSAIRGAQESGASLLVDRL
jgi:hypothetical protein